MKRVVAVVLIALLVLTWYGVWPRKNESSLVCWASEQVRMNSRLAPQEKVVADFNKSQDKN